MIYKLHLTIPGLKVDEKESSDVTSCDAVYVWKLDHRSINIRQTEPDKYYYNYVGLAKEAGIVNGYGDGKFGPENLCTREELMVMVANALAQTGIDITADAAVLDKFADAEDVADWAKPYVAYLVSAGIVNGADGNINSKAYITRAEVAVIMYNIANELGLFSEAEEVIEVVEEETEETTEESAEETTEAAEGETVEETTEAENA